MKPAPTLHPDLAAAIHEVLSRAPQPLNLAKIKSQLSGLYKVPAKLKDALAALLNAEAKSGRVHEWPAANAKAGPRYWDRDSKAWAAPAILEAASVAVPASKLITLAAKQLGKPAAEALINDLIDSGRLIRVPLFGGAKAKLCSRIENEVVFRAELDAARRVIDAGYRRLGDVPAEIERDLPPPAHADQILDALASLEPRKGLLVIAPRLYKALPQIPKDEFDRTLVELQDARRVILHRHSNPHGITPEEQQSLVADGAGNYYVGACWRLD